MATASGRTFLAFHHDAKLYNLETTISAIYPFSELDEANRLLFKQGTDKHFAIVTESTIFHPQGGGQPSDEGTITSPSSPSIFHVKHVRMDAINDGQVLHFGHFASDDDTPASAFQPGTTVTQAIDVPKRIYFSRLHTAGHVLGSAVRHLLENKVPNFDELKASHFPDTAACEFRGLIEGKWKDPIQQRVNEYMEKAMPVEIDFWDEEDFKKNDLERLIPDKSMLGPGETKFRVVRIVGAEVYPCGGTHVDTTDLCGETTVKKISRSKGVSRVSYSVKP
ncbi:Threonyl/alanyl tRNA synthetase, class II-like protein [Naviculisporaceae sp. PSN 640]